jgi:hypothetical protein
MLHGSPLPDRIRPVTQSPSDNADPIDIPAGVDLSCLLDTRPRFDIGAAT